MKTEVIKLGLFKDEEIFSEILESSSYSECLDELYNYIKNTKLDDLPKHLKFKEGIYTIKIYIDNHKDLFNNYKTLYNKPILTIIGDNKNIYTSIFVDKNGNKINSINKCYTRVIN